MSTSFRFCKMAKEVDVVNVGGKSVKKMRTCRFKKKTILTAICLHVHFFDQSVNVISITKR